jgi:predicted dehydrogenase
MTASMDEAVNLAKKVRQAKRLFCLAHHYTGYPMVKEARHLVAGGKLGHIRRVVVEYPQGWLTTREETSGSKQAAWRTDPRRAGPAGCMGDVGIHCHAVTEYVTGLRVTEVCADLTSFLAGRQLDDDGSVLLRFHNGARGLCWASQVAPGERNGLRIRVYGDKGALDWRQHDPNTLLLHSQNKPTEVRRTGAPYVSRPAADATRLPAGGPEGFLEAFANVYGNFLTALQVSQSRSKLKEDNFDYPTVHDGVRGIAFLDAVVQSSKSEDKWIEVPEP